MKGFGTPPRYTLKLNTTLGNFTIPYTVERQPTQRKTDIRACAISRLIFGVLQYPDNERNFELLSQALPVENAQQIQSIGFELQGTDFTGTTYAPAPNDSHRIQIASTNLKPRLGLTEQNLEKDVRIAV